MKYTVTVDDNFHYMDESERYHSGEYETAEEAVLAAKEIVDESLMSLYKEGMTAETLYSSYTQFGEDPFIISDDKTCKFSARDYAGEKSRQICP